MEVIHKLVNSTLYIGIGGELDESSSVFIRKNLDDVMEQYKMQRVVLDLSALSFMDSTGVGVLIGRYKKLKQRSVPIYLAGSSGGVDKVLSLSGIYDIMPKIDYERSR